MEFCPTSLDLLGREFSIRKTKEKLTPFSSTWLLRCSSNIVVFTKYANPSPSSGSLIPRVFSLSLKFASIAMKRLYSHLRLNVTKCCSIEWAKDVHSILRFRLPSWRQIPSRVWTRRTLDRESPVTEIVDWCGAMSSCTPLDVLEMAPLPDTARHFVVPVLSENVSHIMKVTC